MASGINSDKSFVDRETFAILWKYWIKSILAPKSVLLVLNMQNDYLHGNISGISETDASMVINKANFLADLGEFELVIYVLESHPPHHVSFIENLSIYENLMRHSDEAESSMVEIESDLEDGAQKQLFSIWDKVSG